MHKWWIGGDPTVSIGKWSADEMDFLLENARANCVFPVLFVWPG